MENFLRGWQTQVCENLHSQEMKWNGHKVHKNFPVLKDKYLLNKVQKESLLTFRLIMVHLVYHCHFSWCVHKFVAVSWLMDSFGR